MATKKPKTTRTYPKQLQGQALEVISLRTKLEQRTLFLRASLALNTALLSGLLIYSLLNK